MKAIFNYCVGVVLTGCLFSACNTTTIRDDKELVIVLDQSDPLRLKPNADEIDSYLGLKQDLWQGIKVNVTFISDKDVNAEKVITLEKGNRLMGNAQMRTAQIAHFKKDLHTALGGMQTGGSLDHSIIYRAVAKQLNALSASEAINKSMVVYSDLMENADVSFYDPATVALLKTNPGAIQKQLEQNVPLRNLSGIHIWLLSDPGSFEENNTYMAVANMYKQLFESKGATVHIEKTLNL
ncbi:MAG TPA: hypothetical protein VHA56_13955 [Mucilaginibacter sp.]|nr:hypothetical protein [Mucilaginibacter sp.]